MKDLTKEPILKTLLKLSIPIIIANLLQTAYQLTDFFWIGRYGTHGVAAIALCFPIIFFFISFGMGLSVAGSILVSQYKGNKNHEALNRVVGQSLMLIIFISLVLSFVGYVLSNWIISLMGVEAVVASSAVSYLKISFIGNVFVFGFMTVQGLLRGIGEVKIPMFIVLGTVLLNLIVDPLFIMGHGFIPAYGVAGAAITTIITQSIAFVAALIVMSGGKYDIHLKLNHMKPNKKLIKKLAMLGLPSSMEMSARSFGMIIMTYIVASFGTVITAAYGVGHQLFSIVLLPALGLSMATTTLVGQDMGARKIKKAQEVSNKALLIAFVTLSIMGVLAFIFAESLVRMFIPTDIEVIKEGALLIKMMAFSFGFLGAQQVFNGVFRGAGETKIPMIFTMISLWVIQIPFAYFGSMYFGLNAIWISIPLANILVAIAASFWFVKGKWKEKKIVHETDAYE